MHVVPIKSPGVAHLSYVVVDGGEAAVVDPRIDLDVYLQTAKEHQARIRYVFETHRNEDLVSGAAALASRTGAKVLHGTALDFAYGEGVPDGYEVTVGSVRLKVLHTPGHTDESISIALYDPSTGSSAVGVFSGDALFVGDVGRTDFYPERPREVAGALFDSVHETLLGLGEQAILWPAHGAGSVCGGGLADRDVSTLGYERIHNPMLQLDREAFVERKVAEEHAHPPYFGEMERVNKAGHPGLGTDPDLVLLDPDEMVGKVVDVRPAEAWVGSHLPNSLCIPSDMLPAWAGWFLPYEGPITLVGTDTEELEQALLHLARIGYQNVRGALKGGVGTWQKSGRVLQAAGSIDVHTLHARQSEVLVIDVRKDDEWRAGRLEGARHLELAHLVDHLDEVERCRAVVTFCGSGQRAAIAASLLQAAGHPDVSVCFGSMRAWKQAGLPVVP